VTKYVLSGMLHVGFCIISEMDICISLPWGEDVGLTVGAYSCVCVCVFEESFALDISLSV